MKRLRFSIILKRITSGFLDVLPLVGNIKQNLESEFPKVGKVDWLRFLSGLIVFLTFILWALGKIELPEAEQVLKLFR